MDSNVGAAHLAKEIDSLVFGAIDYCLFGALLGISLLIGIYFGFFSKQDSTSEYLYGGKSMNYIPVAVSILASFLSGITFLGVPTEVYSHGSQYLASVISALFIGLTNAYITMPVFHNLELSSCYDYLELRFSRATKTLASVVCIIGYLLYIPIVVYVPALAFSQVTGYSIHAITPIFSIICITYTSMGGVKAVVWTDSIQFIFTIGGLITVLILGSSTVGGLSKVWKIADEGGRIKFFDMDPSLFKRNTFWSMTIGLTFSMFSRFGLGQKFIQRFLAIKKKSDLKKAIFLSTFGWGLLQVGCVLTGLIMYAQYHDCDPLKAKLIKRSDQTLPYYIMDIADKLPGLPGIFLAGLVSSALSTMSASLNTLSGMIYTTFIDQWIAEKPGKEAKAANIMKALCVLIGAICIGMIFIVERLGTIFEMAMSLTSSTEGATLGLLLGGVLFPWIGKTGAITGACSSLLIMGWLVCGVQWHTLNHRLTYPTLPTSVEGCPYPLNETAVLESQLQPNLNPQDEPMILYRISFIYFTLIGGFIFFIVASITSYFVGEMDISKVDPNHLSPIIRKYIPRQKFYEQVPLKELNVIDKEKTDDFKNE